MKINNKINLLIVDDEAEDLKLMSAVLEKEGYRIFTATSGNEALLVLKKNNIQIVLMDILMPDMTGYNTCIEIRKKFNSRPLEIVLISGLTMDHFLEKAIEVGADDFIYKPINIQELQKRMKVAVSRLKNQVKLFMEKEKLEKTVAQKEKYSSKIEKEKASIEKKNEELIDTNKELKKEATYDPLTDLYNRKALFNMIDLEIERELRTNLPLTGIMMDVDHFKRVNDRYGHQVGDVVLQELGRKLKTCLRINDHAGRYGGEEFFLVLSATSLTEGHTFAERFRKELEGEKFTHNDLAIFVTVSMGIAQHRKEESRDSWIERADKAMYKAKSWGRNCIALEEDLAVQEK